MSSASAGIRGKNMDAIRAHRELFPLDVETRIAEAAADGFSCTPIAIKGAAMSFKASRDGASAIMHSQYDPIKEAKTLAEEAVNDPDADLVVVLGFGAGYIVREILTARDNIDVIAVEPSYGILNFLIDTFDMHDLFSDERVMYFIGGSDRNDIENYLSLRSTRKVRIITSRGYWKFFSKDLGDLSQAILNFVDAKSININTMIRFDRLWAYNIICNIDVIPFVHGVNRFFDRFAGVPAVVVSAGPSLERNIGLLGEMKKKALIIAVDTALKPLREHGITPHIAVAIDPQGKNAKYFRNAVSSGTALVSESSIHNEIMRNYPGPIFLAASPFPLAQYLMGFLGDRGELTVGGSVSTAAIDIACRTGANPVIMLGLDLSFPELATHVKGSYHEEDFHTQVTKLDTYDGRIYKYILSGRVTPARNIHGERVYVDARFTMYREWFEKYAAAKPGVKFYNATEGGVALNGMENITLASLAKTLPDRDIDFETVSANARADTATEAAIRREIIDGFSAIRKEIRTMRRLAEDGLSITDKLEHGVRHKHNVAGMVRSLNTIDERIGELHEAKPFVSVTMQRVINYIKEGYAFDEHTPEELRPVIASRELYKEIIRSAEYNDDLIEMGIRKLSKATV
ncbi:MAG: 6-hydroxymethylpterin diphosphokinase MptE-like protein [Spirochaetota bacterium]